MTASPDTIRTQLERVLASELLSKSASTKRLLSYLVERSLAGGEGPKEIEIAIDVFGRDASFNGGEDSVVRVAMRGLRQKLLEYYLAVGQDDPLAFDIPKGAYRVRFLTRQPEAATEPAASTPPSAEAPRPLLRRWQLAAGILLPLLLVSVALNVHFWVATRKGDDTTQAAVRQSPLWAPVAESHRGLTFVLGDLFMFTQTDPATGRTLTVRDSLINSSEDLRAFLAGNPALSANRGLRYSTMLQKSTAIGMFEILRVLSRPDRMTEVVMREDLRAEDLRRNDIVYIGPVSRLGPLASDYHASSRYRFDPASASITDTVSGKTYSPEGGLGELHKDYALVARYPGPAGNQIMVFTSGGRNAGLLEIVRTLTSSEGLTKFMRAADSPGPLPPAFEALVSVAGYKQTDLSAELVQLHAINGTAFASIKP